MPRMAKDVRPKSGPAMSAQRVRNRRRRMRRTGKPRVWDACVRRVRPVRAAAHIPVTVVVPARRAP